MISHYRNKLEPPSKEMTQIHSLVPHIDKRNSNCSSPPQPSSSNIFQNTIVILKIPPFVKSTRSLSTNSIPSSKGTCIK
uniref:Uncharacterized protein MANES_02G082700 n=1 Tax=Rhizophora mucronata TaxID=61149 RepID=A0A2P2J7W6_RHIMU